MSSTPGRTRRNVLSPIMQILLDLPMLASVLKELMALVSITPQSLLVLGMTSTEEGKEKPEASKSRNMMLANLVAELGLSARASSFVSSLGPRPATLAYCADLPGLPTATSSTFCLRLSALVQPSLPQKVQNSFQLPTAMVPVNMRLLLVMPEMGLTMTVEQQLATSAASRSRAKIISNYCNLSQVYSHCGNYTLIYRYNLTSCSYQQLPIWIMTPEKQFQHNMEQFYREVKGKWNSLYPNYFNLNKSISEGRRVSKELAIADPTLEEISMACGLCKIKNIIEPHKCYSRDFLERGRIKVEIFGNDGNPMHANMPTKGKFMNEVAIKLKEIRAQKK